MDNQKISNWPAITAWATAILALCNIGALIFLMLQTRHIGKQAQLLEASFKAAYRPIGSVSDRTDKNVMENSFIPSKNKANMTNYFNDVFLTNVGEGHLIFIGHIYYMSFEELNFRNDFLEGKIENYITDAQINASRRNSMAPKKIETLSFLIKDLPLKNNYYLYSLVFYEDIETNLYDTTCLLAYRYSDFKIIDNKLEMVWADVGNYIVLQYHEYTPAEKIELFEILKKIDHPLRHAFSFAMKGDTLK